MFKIKVITPTGKIYYVNELKNKLYFALHKFIINEDFLGFYTALDEHIRQTAADIDNLTLIDKLSIYLTIAASCIRSTIQLQASSINELENPPEINLIKILESLNEFVIIPVKYTIGDMVFELFYPTKLEEVDDTITFDPLSAIRSVTINQNTYKIETEKDKQVLNSLIPVDSYYDLIKFIMDTFNQVIIFYKGKIEIPLLNQYFFKYLANNIFYAGIQSQFDLMYLLQKHINLSISDFMDLSPADTGVLFAKLIQEKEEEKNALEEQNSDKKEFVF